MTTYYTGPGGNDAWDGKSWPARKETITGLFTVGPKAGERLYVGPGVYRETATLPGHGGILDWTKGTVSVTEGSKIVTGAGTNWDPGVEAGDAFSIPWLAHETDGVGNGAGGFTSASNPFEDTYLGFCINIKTQGSYLVATFVGIGSITVTDVNTEGWPGAGPNEFWIPSNEGSYEIESVDSDTQVTLTGAWSGPTASGLGYDMWRPIYLIGDETGAHTDGIGGICRITGSDNDQTPVRTACIDSHTHGYWTIRGFQVDTTTKDNDNGDNIKVYSGQFFTFEDIRSINPHRQHIFLDDDIDRITVRRCAFFGGIKDDGAAIADFTGIGVSLYDDVMHWEEYALHVENCLFDSHFGVMVRRFHNTTMKSCTTGMSIEGFALTENMDIGGCFFVHDCEMHYVNNIALWAETDADRILGDWNNFWENNQDSYAGTARGPNSTVDTNVYLPELPILVDSYRYPVRWYAPSEWWSLSQAGGLHPPNDDVYGTPRPTLKTKRSRGYYQDFHIERDTTTVYSGEEASLKHPDACTTQFRIPISGDPVTVSVFVQYEANYAGNLPKLVVWQPGQPEVEIVATGAASAWEELSVYFVPSATPRYIWAELVSDNTAGAGNYAVYWQQLSIIPEIG